MPSVERLMNEHAQISAMSMELADAINIAPANVVHQMIAALDAQLTSHLATEDLEVYPHLVGATDLVRRDAVERDLGDYNQLADEWRSFVTQWTVEAINAEPQVFGDACRKILAALDARTALEDEILYPLALGCGALTLRELPQPLPQANSASGVAL